MRVLLDTNVLAAAFGTRGLCSDVLREVLLHHELLVSDEVEVELERTLRTKFRVPPGEVRQALALLRDAGRRASSVPLATASLRDPDDVAILSAAVNGGAAVLVTGDRRFRDLGGAEGVTILSPREFWERVRRGGR